MGGKSVPFGKLFAIYFNMAFFFFFVKLPGSTNVILLLIKTVKEVKFTPLIRFSAENAIGKDKYLENK